MSTLTELEQAAERLTAEQKQELMLFLAARLRAEGVSLLLSDSASAAGASREILDRAPANGWLLITTPYVVEEVVSNLPDLGVEATAEWVRYRPSLVLMDDVLTLDRPAVFPAGKDRPVLFGALAWADVLLTLDRADFGSLFDAPFYGLRVIKPGTFLQQQRASNQLR
jgi:hypothetical protein